MPQFRTHCLIVLISLSGLLACDSKHPPATQAEAVLDTSDPYQLTGSGDTTLVLVHGWNINQDYWSQQVAEFSGEYRILTMNLVTEERLQDSSRAWTVENFARDIAKIIEHENLTNIVLVGHSMGGEIVLALRELLPEQTIAIIGVDCYKDTGFLLTEKVQNHVDSFLVVFEEDYLGNVEKMVMTGLFGSEQQHTAAYERVLDDYQSADPQVAIAIFRNLFPAYAATKDKLAQLPFPLRIIISDYAPFTEEALREYAKSGYQVKTITNSGHFPMIEQPELFNQALRAFLQTL